MCCLIDLVSTKDRLARNIIWAFSAAFTMPKQYKGFFLFFKDTWTGRWTQAHTHTHTFFSFLANIKKHISESAPFPIIICSVLSVLHPTASNQKPDLSANRV